MRRLGARTAKQLHDKDQKSAPYNTRENTGATSGISGRISIMDASFETIKEIRPAYTHPGVGLEPELMERVEIAIVANGWQVIVQKGAHKPGDEVFYIRPDARITNRATWASEETRRYLGAGGRVKTIMIWGNVSEGMILPASALPADVKEHTDDLCEYLGIDHWEPPIPQDMSILICCLPDGIDKSDEEDFQNLSDEDLHLGEDVLVTRKMDGTSCTVYYNPKTDYLAVCSRTMQLKLDCVNNFTAATAPLLPIVKELALHYGETVALRGEVCGAGIQNNKVNKDSTGPATFFMYGTRFPDREDRDEKFGRWGKDTHFLKVNEKVTELGFAPILTVDILGVATVTKEMLEHYVSAPASDGEGVVFNGRSFSYKDKSSEYYSKVK